MVTHTVAHTVTRDDTGAPKRITTRRRITNTTASKIEISAATATTSTTAKTEGGVTEGREDLKDLKDLKRFENFLLKAPMEKNYTTFAWRIK